MSTGTRKALMAAYLAAYEAEREDTEGHAAGTVAVVLAAQRLARDAATGAEMRLEWTPGPTPDTPGQWLRWDCHSLTTVAVEVFEGDGLMWGWPGRAENFRVEPSTYWVARGPLEFDDEQGAPEESVQRVPPEPGPMVPDVPGRWLFRGCTVLVAQSTEEARLRFVAYPCADGSDRWEWVDRFSPECWSGPSPLRVQDAADPLVKLANIEALSRELADLREEHRDELKKHLVTLEQLKSISADFKTVGLGLTKTRSEVAELKTRLMESERRNDGPTPPGSVERLRGVSQDKSLPTATRVDAMAQLLGMGAAPTATPTAPLGCTCINQNDCVSVWLTPHGEAVYAEWLEALRPGLSKTTCDERLASDAPKEWQLWSLMQVFGPSMHMAAASVFRRGLVIAGPGALKSPVWAELEEGD